MIAFLRGRLLSLDVSEIVLDVQGVGYGVRVPLSTYYELESLGTGATAELLIYTQVREDALELYGFLSKQEKALFERLIAVSGIGPKLAQGILSGMAPGELLAALAASEVSKLVRIPGVGKKTAERLVLELKDRARALIEDSGAEIPTRHAPQDDLVEALVGLGYREREARKAAEQVAREAQDASLADGLKLALSKLSRA